MRKETRMEDVMIVGVAGGSASGKTTIIEKLKDYFKDDIEILCHDFYYKANDDLTMEERANLNYDHPNAFETDMMIRDIKALKSGKEIYRPEYDYKIHTRSKNTYLVKPKKVIIIDGFLILENKELRDLMDVKVFVDTDADERLMRRILRDVAERGRTVDSILTQYRDTVKPMHEEFVEPSKKHSDIIIPRGGENKIAIDMMIKHITSLL